MGGVLPCSWKFVASRFLKDWKYSLSLLPEAGVWSGVGGKTGPGKVVPMEFGAGRLNSLSESVRNKQECHVNELHVHFRTEVLSTVHNMLRLA